MNKTLAILGIALVALVISLTFIFAYFWIYSPAINNEGYGTDVPPNSGMMMNTTDLNKLENAKPFDKNLLNK